MTYIIKKINNINKPTPAILFIALSVEFAGG